MSDRITDLLGEVADGVEPGDRLDAIRAATATAGGRRTSWWAAGGVGLLAASVVTVLALTTGGTPRSSDPGPAASPRPAPSAPTTSDPATGDDRVVAVYYIGDTPDGARLFREFRPVPEADHTRLALVSLGLEPLDPDYRTAWSGKEILDIAFDGIGTDGLIQVSLSSGSARRRPADMDEETARLAMEQVVYTAQAAFGARAPVQFTLDGNPIDQVFGVPTSEPLANGDVLSTLAHVSLSDPFEGATVDNDEPLTVRGVGNSFEGNIVTRIQRFDGSEALGPLPAIAGWEAPRLYPYEVTFDLTDLAPGDYVVRSQTDDPSGRGRFHEDSRTITVVD